MKQIEITGSRLTLPRLLNNVELAPESAAPSVSFDLGAAGVQRNDSATIALSLWLTGENDAGRFACLFLDVPSAKALAEKLLEATG
jgi:hypothetical protein